MKKTVVIDLEFCRIPESGQYIENLKSEIIEIGAVMLDEDMKLISRFQEYCKPQYGQVSNRIKRLTGISNEMLEDKDNFAICLRNFLEWLSIGTGDELEICSWSMSDYHQLLSEITEKHLVSAVTDILFAHWRDIQQEFSSGLSYGRPIKLSTAMSAIDSDFEGKAHNALADAENTANLVRLLADKNLFYEKTKTIRSLFSTEDDGSNTLGAMFGGFFAGLALA